MNPLQHNKYTDLMLLLFVQSVGAAIWMVPLGAVLKASGFPNLWPFVFATTATAAIISPLIFGALADRHFAPIIILRWLSIASAILIALASAALKLHWSALVLLGIIQTLSLCSAPIGSVIVSIAFLRLKDAEEKFGPIRSFGTFGWMCGCWLVSLCGADESVMAEYLSAVAFSALAITTYCIPEMPPLKSDARLSWYERLGLDALVLLKNHDHRVIFLTAALLSIPLAVFYPLTPLHLLHLGFDHTSAVMTLGQALEVVASISLARLYVRWPLQWIFLMGLTASILRFLFCAMNGKIWLLAGIALHGFSYALFFVTAQIYLGQCIERAWQVRAQALFGVMTNGLGNLIGFLVSGWWFNSCTTAGSTRWSIFWLGCSGLAAMIMLYFLISYRKKQDGNLSH